MDQNSQVPSADGLSVQPGNLSDDKEQTDGYANHSEKPHDVLDSLMHLTEVKQGGYCRNKSQIMFLMQLVEYAPMRIYLETRFYWGDSHWSAARNGTGEVDHKKVAKKLQESATFKKAVIKD